MKEEKKSWFQGLGYEDRFGPYDVPPTEVRKKRIDIHVILSALNLDERKKISCQSRVFMFF